MKYSEKSSIERDISAKAQIRHINVLEEIADPHKLTQNTHSAFEKIINKLAAAQKSKKLPSDYMSIIKSIYRGRFVCRNTNCFNVTVSGGLINRAIRFLDSLAKELENRNFKIRFIQDNALSLIVAIKDNEQISFKISEGYKYHPINNDLRSELDKLLYRDKEPLPTGKLTVFVSTLKTKFSKSWTDGVSPIEDEFPNIINAFDTLVLKQKQSRVEDAIKLEQHRGFTRIFRAYESKSYLEKSIYESAIQESQSYIAQRNLELYLNYLEAQHLKVGGSLNETALLWFSTVRNFAERQNPVRKRLEILNTL